MKKIGIFLVLMGALSSVNAWNTGTGGVGTDNGVGTSIHSGVRNGSTHGMGIEKNGVDDFGMGSDPMTTNDAANAAVMNEGIGMGASRPPHAPHN